MRPPTIFLLAAVSLALAACGGGGGASRDPAPESPAPDRLVGEILEVREEGRRISGFSLEADGERWEIHIAEDVDYGFDLTHLYEHRDTGDPVDVLLEERPRGLVALRIDDA